MPKRVPKYLKEISTQMEGPTQGDYASEWGFAKGRDETSAWDAEINGGEYLGWWGRGKRGVYYFNDAMTVYRVDNPDSWMGRQRWKEASEASLRRVSSMVEMFNGFAEAYPEHRKLFKDKIAQYLRDQMPCPMYDYDGFRKYTDRFKVYMKEESLLWKLDYWLRGTRLPVLRHYYFHSEFLVRKYRKRVSLY